MFQAPYIQRMKKIKVSTIIATCFLLLLIFYILNILILLFLLNIAHLISKSYTKIAKPNQDEFINTYIEEKPWNRVWESPEPSWSFSCDNAHFEYDLCYLNRLTMVDPISGTLSIVDPTNSTPPLSTRIHPYPRKGHVDAMSRTKELTLTRTPLNKSCTVTHHTPALIFSVGGFTGNVFHDFNEGWIPLFVTVNELFNNLDVILGIFDIRDWWLVKYAELFPHFTRHPIINFDKERVVHCFPNAIVGLKSHGVMTVDPALQRGPHPKTMLDFRDIFVEAYHQSHVSSAINVLPTFSSSTNKPKLAFTIRKDTRKIINQEDVRQAADDVGFEVVVFEVTKNTPMREIYRLINNSHVFMGVHGQGLTHGLFLQPGAIMLQIVPINCWWLADLCYGKFALRLGLEHVTYEIGFNESSLRTDEDALKAITDPLNPAFFSMGMNIDNWNKYMNQDVEIDLVRIKRYLERAYVKAKKLMHKQSSKTGAPFRGVSI